ncbi:amidohydrolase, partial [bacterium]|nr:amidohydrolase [bacterium]
MKKIICITGLFLIFFGNLTAQQTPAEAQSEIITITGATAHIGNGEIIENSSITFEDGKITAIGVKGSSSAAG